MTALFLAICVGAITVVSVRTFKREKKFDEENPVSDYVRGLRRGGGIIEDYAGDEFQNVEIISIDVAKG